MKTIIPVKSLYRKFRVPKHVIGHMEAVARVAKAICLKLNKHGHKIDTLLVVNAALIHDALRVCDFRTLDPKYFQQKITAKDLHFWKILRKKYGKIGHTRALTNYLKKNKYNKLANLVSKHGSHSIDKLKTLEEKVLFYADKRAEGDRIVDLKTRFHSSKKRNGSTPANIRRKIYKLEKELKILGAGY